MSDSHGKSFSFKAPPLIAPFQALARPSSTHITLIIIIIIVALQLMIISQQYHCDHCIPLIAPHFIATARFIASDTHRCFYIGRTKQTTNDRHYPTSESFIQNQLGWDFHDGHGIKYHLGLTHTYKTTFSHLISITVLTVFLF